jgi:hypothetical protein
MPTEIAGSDALHQTLTDRGYTIEGAGNHYVKGDLAIDYSSQRRQSASSPLSWAAADSTRSFAEAGVPQDRLAALVRTLVATA